MIKRFVRRSLLVATLAAATLPAAAQEQLLNESCTVSILNRTAQVNAAGFWQIPNIPADQGPVRARAVCTENGITRVGVSPWMNVPTNGMVFSDGIEFEAAPPVPASLTLSAAKTTFANIGDSVQLQVVVKFPDGTTREIASAAEGTSYTTSNANVATISPSGLVTATGTGTVIVSASNEGALGLLRLSVSTGPLDTDRDGMPDDWERTYGLDPNNGTDATLDLDGDGLNNLAEFRAGTDPSRPDTDGDGVRDGLEIETGSDPLDPDSVNLPAALQGIRTAPAAVVLSKSIFDDSVTKRIRVEGVLRDGAIIDLTARSRGTAYSSSNLQIASFTLVDGEVFAGTAGMATLTVTNGSFTATAPIFVITFNPLDLARLPIAGFANDVEVAGNFAYVAAGAGGLYVVDVTDRAQPRVVGSYDTAGSAVTLRVVGSRVYVADNSGGVAIVDVSVPSQPALVATIAASSVLDVVTGGNYAYLAAGTNLLVADLTTNTVVAQLAFTTTVSAVDLSGNLLIVGTGSGITAVDVTTPAAPVRKGSYSYNFTNGVRILNTYAYVAVAGSRFAVFDISDPSNLRFLATGNSQTGTPYKLAIYDQFAALPNVSNSRAMPIVNISSPSVPVYKGSVFLGSGGNEWTATGGAIDASYVYETATNAQGRQASSPYSTALFIGQWRPRVDTFGNAPLVAITNDRVEAGTTATITVAASDDVGVAAVTLTMNGQSLGFDTTAPYTFSFSVPAGTSVALVAQAVDLAGNVATATATLPIVPDTTPPAARVVAPQNGSVQTGGSTVTVSVDATDAGRITNIEALVNGVSIGSSATYYGNYSWVVPDVDGTATIVARAVDQAGNVGTSQPVTIETRKDNPPTVSLSYSPAVQLYSGGEIFVTVNAQDDYSTPSVQFLVDDVVVASKNYYPFQFTYTAPAGRPQIVMKAVATDNKGKSTTSTPVTIPLRQTSALSMLPLDGFPNDVAVYGNYAYVAAGLAGLHVIDVTDPAAPALVATLDTAGTAYKLDLRWPYVFLADGSAGMEVISVENPASPQIVSTYATAGPALDVFYRANRAYVGQELGFDIVNVADPRAPKRVVFRATQKPVLSISARDGALYLVMRNPDTNRYYESIVYGMQLFDETNPTNGTSLPVYTSDWANLFWANDRLLVSSEVDFFLLRGNSAFPSLLGQTSINDYHYGYTDARPIDANTVLTSSAERDVSSAVILNIATPSSITHIGTINFGGLGKYFGSALEIGPELAYTTAIGHYYDETTPAIVETTGRFFIGRYRTATDSGGSAPAVSVLAPLDNSAAQTGQEIRIQVDASDDVAVKSVKFLAGGVEIGETATAPYELFYRVPAGATQLSITAVATDFAGLVTTSAPVTVNVSSDVTPPTVTLTQPAAGRSLPALAIRLAANAADNASLAKVDFLFNGAVIATDSSYPYDVEATLPAGTANGTIVARATDASGNTADSAAVTVTVMTPQVLGSVYIPTYAVDLDTNGRIAAVAAVETGIVLVDITTPAAPVITATIHTPSAANSVRILGNYVYAGCRNGEFLTIDASNPSAPVTVYTSGTGNAYRLAVSRLTAYTMWSSLILRNITVPTAPTSGVTISPAGVIDADEPRFAIGTYELRAYNAGLLVASKTMFPSWSSQQIASVRVRDGYVVAGLGGNVAVSSIDDKLAWMAQPSAEASVVDFLGDTLVTAGNTSRVWLFEFSDPHNPAFRTMLNFAAGTISAVRLTPQLVLATTVGAPNGRMIIGKYREYSDIAGVAPAVAMQSFTATPRVGQLLNLRATATDDVGVASVVFTVNGVDVFTDSVAPYEFNYLVPSGATSLNVTARATDYAGTSTTSAVRSATVSP